MRKRNNPYGYKVGYRENGSRLFVRYFMTYTYNQALFSRRFYRKYPQRTRETNRLIVNPFWEIIPITKKEYLAGIWDETPFPYKSHAHYLYRWAHCSIAKTRSQREKIFEFPLKLFLLQKFLSFFADFGTTLNSYMVCPFSLCYFGPADKGKINYRSKGMYQENQFRTFNIWRDGDIIHIFLTCSPKKYKQFSETITYVKGILGLNFDTDYDGNQIYFIMGDFDEYKEFKDYFYRYLPCYAKERK